MNGSFGLIPSKWRNFDAGSKDIFKYCSDMQTSNRHRLVSIELIFWFFLIITVRGAPWPREHLFFNYRPMWLVVIAELLATHQHGVHLVILLKTWSKKFSTSIMLSVSFFLYRGNPQERYKAHGFTNAYYLCYKEYFPRMQFSVFTINTHFMIIYFTFLRETRCFLHLAPFDDFPHEHSVFNTKIER